MPEWVSSIEEKVIGFEDQAEEIIDPVTEIDSGPILKDPM